MKINQRFFILRSLSTHSHLITTFAFIHLILRTIEIFIPREIFSLKPIHHLLDEDTTLNRN